jgi:hypothetical protein
MVTSLQAPPSELPSLGLNGLNDDFAFHSSSSDNTTSQRIKKLKIAKEFSQCLDSIIENSEVMYSIEGMTSYNVFSSNSNAPSFISKSSMRNSESFEQLPKIPAGTGGLLSQSGEAGIPRAPSPSFIHSAGWSQFQQIPGGNLEINTFEALPRVPPNPVFAFSPSVDASTLLPVNTLPGSK